MKRRSKKERGRSCASRLARGLARWHAISDCISGALADAGDIPVPQEPEGYADAIRLLSEKRKAEVKRLTKVLSAACEKLCTLPPCERGLSVDEALDIIEAALAGIAAGVLLGFLLAALVLRRRRKAV